MEPLLESTNQIAFWLPVVWAVVIGIAIIMYVILDGFDLGIGILLLTTGDETHREQMMNTVAPFWDGNEIWLLLSGVGLFVAFPLAHAIIGPAFTLPLILMVLGLVLRGVAFEVRYASKPHQKFWDRAFAAGSAIAAFCQGAILGRLVLGIEVENNKFAGGPFDWLSPFAIVCGLGVMAGYALFGCAWLMIKTEGRLKERATRHARIALLLAIIFIAIVSLWTPLADARIAERWFTWDNFVFLWPVPLLTALFGLSAWIGTQTGSGLHVFAASVNLFLLCVTGLAISSLPYIIPPSMTIWQAAAVSEPQIVMLIATLLLLPLILGYTVYVSWKFRGKVSKYGGNH
jgi:cytochrome d ubiquinol oxidase subunit II